MKFYGRKIVERARLARRKGLSLRAIEIQLGVPNSTISTWVRDVKSNNHFYQKARLSEREEKNKFSHLLKDYEVDKDQAKILLSLLYWCEGSKYPSTNCVAFSNSDYVLLKTFIYLMRKGFAIEEEKFRVRLQLHTTHDIRKENNFWSRLLKISLTQFGKPTITIPKDKRKRSVYRGTCTIKYYDVKLLLQLTGIFEAFAGKFGEVPEWTNGTRC